jgi:hypothetical protein
MCVLDMFSCLSFFLLSEICLDKRVPSLNPNNAVRISGHNQRSIAIVIIEEGAENEPARCVGLWRFNEAGWRVPWQVLLLACRSKGIFVL